MRLSDGNVRRGGVKLHTLALRSCRPSWLREMYAQDYVRVCGMAVAMEGKMERIKYLRDDDAGVGVASW